MLPCFCILIHHSLFSYFLVNFDSPISVLEGLKEHMARDSDIIRRAILRKEEELRRPCETDPCHFGELNEEVRKKVYLELKNNIKKLWPHLVLKTEN